MAVVSANEIVGPRSLIQRLGGWNSLRTYERTWQVKTDSKSDTAQTVLQYSTIPLLATFHPEDSASAAVERRADQNIDNPLIWTVTVTYSNEVSGDPSITDLDVDGGGYVTSNPLAAPADVQWGTIIERKELTYDINGELICNTVGDVFENVQEDIYVPTVRISRNESYYTVQADVLKDTYEGAVNADVFSSYQPGEVMIYEISLERHLEHAIQYWRITYGLMFKRLINLLIWNPSILFPTYSSKSQFNANLINAGYRGRAAGSPTDSDIVGLTETNDQGGMSTLTVPAKLDGYGYKVTDPAQFGWRSFETKKRAAFEPLGLTWT